MTGLHCPGCGVFVEGEGQPGMFTVCPGCDLTLKVPESVDPLWFEQVAQKDVPIRMLIGLDHIRHELKKRRNGKHV